MGVKVTKRAYNDIYTDDETTWLIGNVGDWQRLTIEVEASVDFFPTQAESVVVDLIQNTFTLQSGKKWADMGFDIGQQFLLHALFQWDHDGQGMGDDDDQEVIDDTYTIVNIYGSTIEVLEPIQMFYGLLTLPSDYGTKKVSEISFRAGVEPEGFRLVYAHKPNAEANDEGLNSFIDGSTTMFVQPNVKGQDYYIEYAMEAVGLQSGMSARYASITKLGIIPDTGIHKYRIIIQYLISSFFDTAENIQNGVMPEYLNGDGSLTDNFKLLFYPKWNNPNTLIQNDLAKTARLGNTGWFNENFNQLPNDFAVTDVTYSDENGNIQDALDYYASTKVTAKITGVPNVTAATKAGFGFMWVPKYEDDYKSKETPFHRNTFINTGSPDVPFDVGTFYPDTYNGNGIGSAYFDVKSIRFLDLGGGVVGFEAIFTPTPDFTLLFDSKDADDRKYLLWLSIADRTLDWNFSDRVSLLADVNNMIKTVPAAGAYPYLQNEFLEHPYGSDEQGVEEYSGFVQDDVLCRMPFQVNPTTTQIRRMRFGIEMYNTSTTAREILEDVTADMTQYYSDVNGVPQFNLNLTRGFKLQDGNNKNWVRINRAPTLDSAGRFGYMLFYAFKIRWEDWIAKAGLPADFFKVAAANQGFNNDWVQLLATVGWSINFFVDIEAVSDTELVQYRNRFNFKFADNDLNTRIETAHRYYRDSDDTLLNIGTDPETNRPLGVIISNEPTRLEIDYEIMDGGVWDPNNVYATCTIEIDKGAGFMQMRQLSSVWGSEADNPLKPIAGSDKLMIAVDNTNKILTTYCLIDPDLLQGASRYRITGRVGCYTNGGSIRFGLYESRYENLYE